VKSLKDLFCGLRRAADKDLLFPLEERADLLSGLYLFFLFILCFVKLQPYVLPQLDDMTHAAIGASILQTGDWFTMHEGSAISWLKPPLYFWIEAVFFKLFSVNEYWAKFPAALTGFLTFLFAHKTAKELYGKKVAFLTLFVLSTSLFFLRYTQRCMLDMPIAFAVTLSVYSAVKAGSGGPKYFLLYGPAVALGYYFKGLQGLYALAIVPLYLFFSGRRRELLSPWLLGSLAAGLALIGAWALPQYLKYGREFLNSQCGIGPLTAGGLPGYENPFYRPAQNLFRMFYWSVFSFYGMWLALKKLGQPGGRGAAAALFAWFWVILGAISVSSVFGVRYLVPALVPAGIFAALALDKLLGEARFKYFQHWAAALFGLAVLLVALLPTAPAKEASEFISLYRTVNTVTRPGDRIVLYKERVYIFNQGLVFYSAKELAKQIFSAEELAAEAPEAGKRTFVIVMPGDYPEIKKALPEKRLFEFASDKTWVLLELLP